MKKRILSVFILLIAFTLLITAQAEDLYSISQLYDQTPRLWSDTYITSRGNTVTVSCDVVLPEVDALPVIQVRPMVPRSKEIEKQYTANAVYSSSLEAYVSSDKSCLAFENHDGIFFYGKHGFGEYMRNYVWTNKYDYKQNFLLYDDAELGSVYPEDSRVTLGEAIEYYQNWVSFFFPDEKLSMRFSPVKPSSYRSSYFDSNDNHQITPCGYYDLAFDQVIHGIPILLRCTFNQDIKSKAEDTLKLCEGRGELSLAEPDTEFGIRANLCQEISVYENDVPVVDFDTVRKVLEEEIIAGRLQEISRIELGYCVYTDDKSNDFCWLVPVWVCRSTFTEEKHTLLVISGQYGKLNEPQSRDQKRSVCPKIISWNDIEGRR